MTTRTQIKPRVNSRKKNVSKKLIRKVTIVYTKPFVTDGREYHGRLPNGKVSLNQKENHNCIEMLKRGMGHQAIADELDMTLSQVQYRAKMAQVSVMSYRRGESTEARIVLKQFTVRYRH